MKLSKILLALMLAFAFASCGDDEGDPNLTVALVGDSSTFAPGDVIKFDITMMDDTGLSSLSIANEDLNLSDNLNNFSGETNASLEYSLFGTANVVAQDYEIIFTLSDIDNNSKEEKVKITITE